MNVQIRNVPPATHRVLRARAERAGMSMQEYLLDLLTEHASRPAMAEVLDRAERRAGRVGLRRAAADLRRERDRR